MTLFAFLPRLSSVWANGIVLSLGVWLVLWPAGGPGDSVSAQGAKPGPHHSPSKGSKDAGIDRAIAVYHAHCVECHDLDGRGESGREMMRRIPDFTDSRWQDTRGDLELARSIIEGKRTMPAMKSKLQAGELEIVVRLVRSFRDGRFQIPEDEDETEKENSSRTEPSVSSAVSPTADRPSQPAERVSPPPGVNSPDAGRALFQRLCANCHGADGTGSQARDEVPETPDFTEASWQARRSDAQMMASILDGKGSEMPPLRGKISDEQVRGLVAYIRSFSPSVGTSGPGQPDGLALPGSAQAKPPTAFLAKLIRWLGRFHPPLVHFPIALLTAAAVAELLRLVTGKLEFDAISRFCLWFGAFTAVAAGILGWFLAGFRLTDASWAMMMHRWIGTFTVPVAVLSLVLSEMSRPPARRRTKVWYRVALFVTAALVSVTGFFGGSVVFGLNYHDWPR
jgi:mono/diheme cytochrome c family protein/uncharacterized membrane protein